MGHVAELEPDLRPLLRRDYARLVELGAFEEERVELLHGVVVRMSPHSPEHDLVVQRLTAWLVLALHARASIRVQCGFAAGDDSEPEPDVAVVPPGDYRQAHPNAAHLLLEVASTSLARDRNTKARLYAASGVPEYWIVNLIEHTIEVRTDPDSNGYHGVRIIRGNEPVAPGAFPDVEITPAALFE